MIVSVIVPAWNEEKLITRALHCIKSSLRVFDENGWSHEIIVVNNNSTDRTAELAAGEGTQVVFEPFNQISRARNRGAREAKGDWLVFIDADSYPTPELFSDMAEAIRSGRNIGGGCEIRFDSVKLLNHASIFWNTLSYLTQWAAGSFIFCEGKAFRETGGFREDIYASEEIHLSEALKRYGRKTGKEFCILRRHYLLSSGRKGEQYSLREFLTLFVKILMNPFRFLKSRANCNIWYDNRR